MPRVRTALLLTATLAVASLSACASGGDAGSSAPRTPAAQHAQRRHAATASPSTPAATPTTAAPAPSSSPAPAHGTHPGRHKVGPLQPLARASSAQVHLLAADRLPDLGAGTWTVTATSPDDAGAAPAVGACQKTGLGAIGAVDALRRTFGTPEGARATEVVARFADARSAWRAHRVLTAWRDDCEQRLALPASSVGPMRPVTVARGVADSYRAAYGDKQVRATGLGILRTGSTLTVVEVTAPRAMYPGSWDPARVAVRRVARTF